MRRFALCYEKNERGQQVLVVYEQDENGIHLPSLVSANDLCLILNDIKVQDADQPAWLDAGPYAVPRKPDWIPAGNHYVVIAERDGSNGPDGGWLNFHAQLTGCPADIRLPDGPITWETYLTENTALSALQKRKLSMPSCYGRTVIARLVFDVNQW